MEEIKKKEWDQKKELESLCASLEKLNLPELSPLVFPSDIKEISQRDFLEVLCEKIQKGKEDPLIIDVRSESEYRHNGLFMAYNLPLLGDRERHEVGLLYKRESHQLALRYALYLARKKEKAFISEFKRLSMGRSFILYCWRGGGRSAYTAALLEGYGFKVVRLKGGSKGFRKEVYNLLYNGDFTLWPLWGLTACGKSELLERLELEYPHIPVLHLEKIAGHASSVFGHLRRFPGELAVVNNQQRFENLLYFSLLAKRRPDGSFPPFITEMESRKIGMVQLPPALFKALQKGPGIAIESDMENRIRRLEREYFSDRDKRLPEFLKALETLRYRLDTKLFMRLKTFLNSGDIRGFLKEILENYYDKGYKNLIESSFLSISTDDFEAGLSKLLSFFEAETGIKRD